MSNEFFERYKRPEWQKKKAQILDDASYTCRRCSAKNKTMHVHHTHYIKDAMPWEYEDEDLIALCEDCHMIIEAQSLQLRKLSGRLFCFYERFRGYMAGLYYALVDSEAMVFSKDDPDRSDFIRGLADVFKVNPGQIENVLAIGFDGEGVFDRGSRQMLFGKWLDINDRDELEIIDAREVSQMSFALSSPIDTSDWAQRDVPGDI